MEEYLRIAVPMEDPGQTAQFQRNLHDQLLLPVVQMEESRPTAALMVDKVPIARFQHNLQGQPLRSVRTVEFHPIAAQTEVKDQIALFRRSHHDQPHLLDVRMEESLRTVVLTEARGQTVLSRLPLQVVLTEEFLLTAVQTVDKDPTV